MTSVRELVETAKEIRKMVRGLAGLSEDWEKATSEMQSWYLMLAKRAEGIEEQVQ